MPDGLECNFRINNKLTHHLALQLSVGDETATIHMHEKGNLAGAFWLALPIITGRRGLVCYLIDVKQNKVAWSWMDTFVQVVVSGFASVTSGLISIENGFSIYMTPVTTGISDAMDSVALTYFWERLTGVKNVKS